MIKKGLEFELIALEFLERIFKLIEIVTSTKATL